MDTTFYAISLLKGICICWQLTISIACYQARPVTASLAVKCMFHLLTQGLSILSIFLILVAILPY